MKGMPNNMKLEYNVFMCSDFFYIYGILHFKKIKVWNKIG